MSGDEERVPSFGGEAPVRHDSNDKLDGASLGLVIALPSKSRLVASPRQRSLLHNGHVETCLGYLLLEPADGKSMRNLDGRVTAGCISAEIDTPPVHFGWQLTEQPVATMVGVPTRERAKEVVQHALQDSP